MRKLLTIVLLLSCATLARADSTVALGKERCAGIRLWLDGYTAARVSICHAREYLDPSHFNLAACLEAARHDYADTSLTLDDQSCPPFDGDETSALQRARQFAADVGPPKGYFDTCGARGAQCGGDCEDPTEACAAVGDQCACRPTACQGEGDCLCPQIGVACGDSTCKSCTPAS